MGTNPGDSFSTACTGKGVIYWALSQEIILHKFSSVCACHTSKWMYVHAGQSRCWSWLHWSSWCWWSLYPCRSWPGSRLRAGPADPPAPASAPAPPPAGIHWLFLTNVKKMMKKDTIKLLLYLLTKTSMCLHTQMWKQWLQDEYDITWPWTIETNPDNDDLKKRLLDQIRDFPACKPVERTKAMHLEVWAKWGCKYHRKKNKDYWHGNTN